MLSRRLKNEMFFLIMFEKVLTKIFVQYLIEVF